VILEQHYLGCLAHASYLIAEQRSGVAVVVDPQRDVGRYLDAAERAGCRIDHVFLTHFHADFLAGDRRELVADVERLAPSALAERLGQREPPTVLDVRSPQSWPRDGSQVPATSHSVSSQTV